ncbi:unnamed protein product [Agarophyton chilense]
MQTEIASDLPPPQLPPRLGVTAVPSSKGHRPWKKRKRRPAAAQRRTAALKLTLDQKNRRREQRETLRSIVRAAKEADAAAKEAERNRIAEKRKRDAENEARGTQKVVITNPKKLARMSKKQFLNYVHNNNLKKE